MTHRSNRAEVRNPLLGLPAVERLRAAPPETRLLIEDVLREISLAARERAERSWRQNKGPMAAYWKAVGAYSKHLRAALRRSA